MKKYIKLILLILMLFPSSLFAKESLMVMDSKPLKVDKVSTVDPVEVKDCSMKVKISGNTEYIINIMLKDFTKVKNNRRGIRQAVSISMKEPELKTICLIFNDDSKGPQISTCHYDFRRIKRHTKAQFENNEYLNTTLTLKEIMDTAVKLIYRDQVKVNDTTVTVMERNIGYIDPKELIMTPCYRTPCDHP